MIAMTDMTDMTATIVMIAKIVKTVMIETRIDTKTGRKRHTELETTRKKDKKLT